MISKPDAIPKQAVLKAAEDYYRLRREGIGFIQQMGSDLWTDYNSHDPGITILEALCFAITDLGYRSSWDIKDILASHDQPFAQQAFFTAREILTVDPVSPDDFRRLLIDLDGVRNAWVYAKQCACDLSWYVWCDAQKQLQLGYQKPLTPVDNNALALSARGLYEVRVELENDIEFGDLNDRKLEVTFSSFTSDDQPYSVTMELRFPLMTSIEWQAFNDIVSQPFTVTAIFDADGLNAPASEPEKDDYLRSHWRKVFYIHFEFNGKKEPPIAATLCLFGTTIAKNATTVGDLLNRLSDKSTIGVISRYHQKRLKTQQAINTAKTLLHQHRNLGEDYCTVAAISVEDIAVCADVEVTADADIELVQAKIWLRIEQYFNPPVPFYSLAELTAEQIAVEQIFNGPALNNGFIKADELAAATIKTLLQVSDIINELMDIDGVIAVNDVMFTKYDAEGQPIEEGVSWLLNVSNNHQPRLYRRRSRFLFYKQGLPFAPRVDEVFDTYAQLRGEAERPKIKNTINDLPIPQGTVYHLEDYTPVQYSLPLTYGISIDGLPANATALRQAQALQLKAYLMVFEQHLSNAFAQLAHTADLFSLNPAVQQSYFVHQFSEEILVGYDKIIAKGLDLNAELKKITETPAEFHDRRNRFLNHLMARFGEQFGEQTSEYALLLVNSLGKPVADDHFIDDKISFLNAYPSISHDRGKAFNYQENPYQANNVAGIKKRVSLLLGYPDLSFTWQPPELDVGNYSIKFTLNDSFTKRWFSGQITLNASAKMPVEATAQAQFIEQQARREIIRRMAKPDDYVIAPKDNGQFSLQLNNIEPLANDSLLFATKTQAEDLRDELVSWSNNERAIVVEHLLLRPKFIGDALYPVCSEEGCSPCDADPYSFRLTFVMPGWTAPYNLNLDMRQFAERTIRREIPAHLLGKICWVGNDDFINNEDDPVVSDVAELLFTKGLTSIGISPSASDAYECALKIYNAFSTVFDAWYTDKTLDYIQTDALIKDLQQQFANIEPETISCTTVLKDTNLWLEINTLLLKYFHHIALYGRQFERFENAWYNWLEVNSAFDWTEQALQTELETILRNAKLSESEISKRACEILRAYGTEFYQWMEKKLNGDMTDFTPSSVDLPAAEAQLLNSKYANQDKDKSYQTVSTHLRIVVDLLSNLRNIYPSATLHDCDDGSDENPVRLDNTALGGYPLRTAPKTS